MMCDHDFEPSKVRTLLISFDNNAHASFASCAFCSKLNKLPSPSAITDTSAIPIFTAPLFLGNLLAFRQIDTQTAIIQNPVATIYSFGISYLSSRLRTHSPINKPSNRYNNNENQLQFSCWMNFLNCSRSCIRFIFIWLFSTGGKIRS